MSGINNFRCTVYYLRPGHLTEREQQLNQVDNASVSEGGELLVKSVHADGRVERMWIFARGEWLRVEVEDVGAQTDED